MKYNPHHMNIMFRGGNVQLWWIRELGNKKKKLPIVTLCSLEVIPELYLNHIVTLIYVSAIRQLWRFLKQIVKNRKLYLLQVKIVHVYIGI